MTAVDLVRIRRALLSVSDKTGLVTFAQALAGFGVELVSTGGTAKTLQAAGLTVVEVADYTGFPEIMDGRVKTLHPKVHGGILALRDVPAHAEAMQAHGIPPIDMVVVNLYPFEMTVARGADHDTAIEHIDIGGPALVRAAAKNHAHVAVVADPADYSEVLDALKAHDGRLPYELRHRLAAVAYGRTAAYDAEIAQWLERGLGHRFPERLLLGGRRTMELRYGENPHQQAAFYADGSDRPGVATARQVQGKALSYNNLNDTDAAYELVAEFPAAETAAVAIVKHANPCGVGLGATLAEAYAKALKCDPVSAFGGVIALNRPLDAATAEEIARIFTEVIIAPAADEAARRIVGAKKNLRLLLANGLPDPAVAGLTVRSLAGGLLVQSRDVGGTAPDGLTVPTRRAPSEAEMRDLLFAWRVAKHVKSNAIVYAKNGATVGIGAGQMSRVDSARIALRKAQDAAAAAGEAEPLTKGSVAASDAFFPFADGLLVTAEAGCTAVIQPGGSMRDREVIDAADEAGLAMVFTGMRHFRH